MADMTEKILDAVENFEGQTEEKISEVAYSLDEKVDDAAVKAMAGTALEGGLPMDVERAAVLDKLGEKVENYLEKEDQKEAKKETAEKQEWTPLQFPSEKDKPVSELMAEYKELKEKVDKMDMDNLSAEDRQTLTRYAEVKDFLNDIRNSLDFVKASTLMLESKDGKGIECRSLLRTKEQYADLSSRLTNNFDEEFIREVERSRDVPLNPEPFGKQEYLASVSAPLKMAEIEEELKKSPEYYTVGDVGEAIETARNEMDFNYIDHDNIVNSTLLLFLAEDKNDHLSTLTAEEVVQIDMSKRYEAVVRDKDGNEEVLAATDDWNKLKFAAAAAMIEQGLDVEIRDTEKGTSVTLEAEKYKENYNVFDRLNGYFPVDKDNLEDVDYENQHKPVEIVESSDGYVMASSEITAENEAEFNSRVNQANNEVVHNEAPQETTIDPSAVGGKVKLETVEDLGSKELKQIEHGGGAYGSLESRYENTKYDETPTDPNEDEYYEEIVDEPEQGGYEDR